MHLLSLSQHQDLYDHGGTEVASGETVSFQGNCHPVGEEGTCIKRELIDQLQSPTMLQVLVDSRDEYNH